MFADFTKIAVKIGVLTAIFSGFVILFNLIPVPNLEYSLFNRAIGKGYAILSHWVPGFQVIYGFAVAVFNLWLAVALFRVSIITYRFILKVNE